ncbi:MAG: HAD family hydrolase [Firmicutes bacterium]|nr:HAD family hydrolase [Bacillota bacterium]
MKYTAIIFDLDGTLLNTLEDLADSVNAVLQQNGFSVHDLEMYKYFIGDGIANLVRRALPPGADNAIISKLINSVKEEYNRRWARKTKPYPGIPELLRELQTLKIPVAILTNKPDSAAQNVVRHFFPDSRFEIIQGAIPSLPLKPDPSGALAIAAAMKIAPDQFLYLGDTGTDMQTAVAAGMHPVGVLWGFRTGAELLQNGAELLLEKPVQLLDILKEGSEAKND